MKKIIILLAIVVLFAGCQKNPTKILSTATISQTNTSIATTSAPSAGETVLGDSSGENKPVVLPDKINLEVPFVSQAPFREWDDLHNEACEEASVLSVILFLNDSNMDASQKDEEIKKMINWQEGNFGGHYDLPLEKVKELVEIYYHKSAKIIDDVTIDSIKQELANNNPIIIPAAGRVLGNPYFKTPGPVYHMLVIRGYDDNPLAGGGEFITNDVGTNTKGENFRYKYDKLLDAIHDMPSWQENKASLDVNPDIIFSGQRKMLVTR